MKSLLQLAAICWVTSVKSTEVTLLGMIVNAISLVIAWFILNESNKLSSTNKRNKKV